MPITVERESLLAFERRWLVMNLGLNEEEAWRLADEKLEKLFCWIEESKQE